LQFAIASTGSGSGGLTAILIPLGIAELIAILLSAGGILMVLVLWGADALYSRFGRPPKDGVQKLFDDKDDTKRGEH
jgi:hypothetical protein